MYRLLMLIIILFLHFGWTIEDDHTYSGGELPEIFICTQIPFPDSLKADQLLLARLIYSEAGEESLDGKRAVADVVVYIAKHHDWTLKRTIYDGGRFDGIRSNNFNINPLKEYASIDVNISLRDCMLAARKALLGRHILPEGILFYHNPATSTDGGWVSYIEQFMYRDIGNHRFCYHPEYFS